MMVVAGGWTRSGVLDHARPAVGLICSQPYVRGEQAMRTRASRMATVADVNCARPQAEVPGRRPQQMRRRRRKSEEGGALEGEERLAAC